MKKNIVIFKDIKVRYIMNIKIATNSDINVKYINMHICYQYKSDDGVICLKESNYDLTLDTQYIIPNVTKIDFVDIYLKTNRLKSYKFCFSEWNLYKEDMFISICKKNKDLIIKINDELAYKTEILSNNLVCSII